MLIAPSEPPELRALGRVSQVPEAVYGADFLWVGKGAVWGVQRKEVADLLSSAEDGRLGQQVTMMAGLDVGVVLVEGKVRAIGGGEDGGGVLDARGGGRFGRVWSMKAYRGLLWSVASRGIWVDRTANLTETAQWLGDAVAWSTKDKHAGLLKREGVRADMWGRVGSREYVQHLLAGLPGIGHEMAGRIFDEMGCPLGLKDGVDRERLMQVKGLGKGRVDKILGVLNARVG